MSAEKRSAQAMRWFSTAKDDLQTADILYRNQKFAQSCFFSQQAGEKAIKALYFFYDSEPWGHSIYKLVKELNQPGIVKKVLEGMLDRCRELDRYYIPTRYPDGLPGTTPAEAYGSTDAESALKAGQDIMTAVENQIVNQQ
jgi:HEPN domain-containing protein